MDEPFVAIPRKVFDALMRTRIPGEQRQVLDVIMRQTYGWGKAEDCIGLNCFADTTGIDKGNVCRALRGLLSKKTIVKLSGVDSLISSYKVNEKTEEWRPLSKKTNTKNIIKKDKESVVKKDTHNRKKNIERKKDPYSPQFLKFWEKYPRKVGKAKAFKAWLKAKGYSPDNLLEILESHKQQDQWIKDGGEFIPHASTWLNGRRWEDEIQEKPKGENEDVFRRFHQRHRSPGVSVSGEAERQTDRDILQDP